MGYGAGVTLAIAVWTIAIVGFGAELTRRLVARTLHIEAALPATIMVWLGTPCLYYTLVSPLYSHAIAWAMVSLMVWTAWSAMHSVGNWKAWLTVGLMSGIVLSIRLQDAPLLVIPVTLLVFSARSGGKEGLTVKFLSAWLFGMFTGFLPQA